MGFSQKCETLKNVDPKELVVTPRPTDSTREFENLSDEAEELCYSSLFLAFM